MFEAYITNLGKYGEGKMYGEFLKFPTTTEKVQALLARIKVDGVMYEEYFITDYRHSLAGMGNLGEYESINELNYLASLLEDMNDWEREKFSAAVACGEHTGSAQDLINLAQNIEDCYEYYPGVNDYDEFGRYLIDELDYEKIPEHLVDYFDYESYGENYVINQNSAFVDGGFVFRNDVDFSEYYSGRDDLPEEYMVFAYPAPEKSISKAIAAYTEMIADTPQAVTGRPVTIEGR